MMAKENKTNEDKKKKKKRLKKPFISQFHHQEVWCILTDRQKGSFMIILSTQSKKTKQIEWKIKEKPKLYTNDI